MKVHDEATTLPKFGRGDSGLLLSPPKIQSFRNFRKTGRSRLLALVLNIFFSVIYVPFYFVDHYVLHSTTFQDASLPGVLHCIQAFLLVISVIANWVVLALFRSSDPYWVHLRQCTKSFLMVTITVFFSLHAISSMLMFGTERSREYGFEVAFSSVLLIIVPPAIAEVHRMTNNLTFILCWGISVLTFAAFIAIQSTWNSVIVFLVYLVCSLLILLDRYLFTLAIFEANQDLENQIERYTNKATEQKANEMRGIIASISHDLKTPLASFMTAIETVEMDITAYSRKCQLSENRSSVSWLDREGFINSLTSSIKSIKEIHAFMLMMINRSIDFKKASAGINLVPCIETIDLSTIVMMPVRCMQNMQQKIGVRYEGIRGEIHPWIKTDQQWLQENLLCLLSNAVKYSMCGEVELCISVQKAESLKKVAGKVVDEVQVKRKLHTSDDSSSIFSYPSRNKAIISSDRGHNMDFSSNRSRIFVQTTRETDLELGLSIDVITAAPDRETMDTENDQRQLLFEVKDRGEPLSDKAMKVFFNPFKQSRLSGGNGLGLYALAKRIEALGGLYGIRQRGDEYSGAVVWFSLPYEPVLQRRRNNLQESTPTSNSTFCAVQEVPWRNNIQLSTRSTVLVVDDSPTIVKMTCMMLKKQNIDTDIAENGKIALEKVIASYSSSSSTSPSTSSPARKYAAVLMDFQMPEMDGIEATKRIREYESQHGIECPLCIIGISAMSDSALIEEGKAKGMTAFVPKPFANKDFLSYLQSFTNRYTA